MIGGILLALGVGAAVGAALRIFGWRRRTLERRRLDGLGVVASHREARPRDGN